MTWSKANIGGLPGSHPLKSTIKGNSKGGAIVKGKVLTDGSRQAEAGPARAARLRKLSGR